MELKYLHLHDVKADDAARTVEGWASTFGNTDSDNDIIVPGAFAASIKARMPKMCWQHDTAQIPGIWTDAQETAQGLYVKGTILDTTLGSDVYKLLKAGAIDRMSIGYVATKSTTDDQTWIRTIQEIDLWEVSLVTFPANDQARVTSVKTAHDTEREFEQFLREAGYSRDASKIITARGFKALSGQREAEASKPDHTTLISLLNQFRNIGSK